MLDSVWLNLKGNKYLFVKPFFFKEILKILLHEREKKNVSIPAFLFKIKYNEISVNYVETYHDNDSNRSNQKQS